MACQLLVDSSLEVTHHPWDSSWASLYEAADHVGALVEGEFGKRVLLPCCGQPAPLAGAPVPATAPEKDEAAQPACVRLHVGPDEALAGLAEVVARATSRIDILMFEWDHDPVGKAVAAWLAARAGPDLPVRVLVDGAGTLIFGGPDDASADEVQQSITQLARRPHVQVLFTRTPFGRFDHRKLVLADGCVAWTGGRNIVRRAFFEHRDLSFTVTGPVAEGLAEQFEQAWQAQGGPPAYPTRSQPTVVPAGAPGRLGTLANVQARLLRTEPGNHEIERELYRAVDGARCSLYVENAYLTDSRLVWKLAKARRRGVDVRVVTSVHTDSQPMSAANRVTANRLFRAGVRVYLYPAMTHAKALAVDGCWAYTGTGNLDPLSLRHNREVGLALEAGPVLQELQERFFATALRPDWEMHGLLPVSLGDYLYEWLASWCL